MRRQGPANENLKQELHRLIEIHLRFYAGSHPDANHPKHRQRCSAGNPRSPAGKRQRADGETRRADGQRRRRVRLLAELGGTDRSQRVSFRSGSRWPHRHKATPAASARTKLI